MRHGPAKHPTGGARLKAEIAARAATLGFDTLRVTTPDAIPEAAERLRAWLADGHHGSMGWMADRVDRRASPALLWGEVRSIVMLGASTAPPHDPLALLAERSRGLVATYAARRDYHEVIKGRLKEVASVLTARSGRDAKVFVDTAPVMEKALAAASGLGWAGKHSVVVSREHGSWLLLGAIFTAAVLPPDEPEPDRCGSCQRCLQVCPTDAFPAPYRLDARRCIAYLTIEHPGHIPAEFRESIGNRVFGCDDCLAVCPWNKFAAASRDARMAFRDDLAAQPLADLLRLDDAAFRARFAGTPVKRTGRDRFVRNVLVAAGNSGDPGLTDAVLALVDDPSPLVRAMAAWAAGRLLPAPAFTALATRRLAGEGDPEVAAEWRCGSPAREEFHHLPHAEVAAAGRPRSTRDRHAFFEAGLRPAPQDEEERSTRSPSPDFAPETIP